MSSHREEPTPPPWVALVLIGVGVIGAAIAFWPRAPAPAPAPAKAPDPPPAEAPSPRRRAPTMGPSPASSRPGNASPPPSSAASSTVPYASEADYLQALKDLSIVDKERALDLAEAGDDWYGESGRGAEARRAMAITLLVDLQRMPDARERTREFIRRYPDSSYRRLVQGQTGVHPRPQGPNDRP